MRDFYDELETRSHDVRESMLFARLPGQIRHAQANSVTFGELLADTHAGTIVDRGALAALPVLRKSAMLDLQQTRPPFGGLAAATLRDIERIYASPGPIYEPETRRSDYWRLARALYAAGFRQGDLVHNTFAYHFTPGGWMLDSGARALGCAVFPAGVGQTEQQVSAISALKPCGYVGTPSFLKIILDKAVELGRDVSSLSKALVSGEALPPSLRAAIRDVGVNVYQCYATADLGLIAYESQAMEGMIVDEELILEIVRPGTGDPVEPGEVGEVVVTSFNPDYPLIRFATGDLSALLPGTSPCGRTNLRIRGWMGRADQTTKVKGMFVRPEQIAAVTARHAEIAKARLVVDRQGINDRMTLRCEVAGESPGLPEAIAATIRELCKLRGEVELVKSGTLPNDGMVIEDIRTYE